METTPTAVETSAQEIQNPTLNSNAYVPESDACVSIETIVPSSMRYEMRKAVEHIDRRVNGVDEYVAMKLGYILEDCSLTERQKGLQCLCDAFAAEQVDALAIAIYNIEQKGQGLIIGDQTGIGKGRQAAGMIRYAIRRGLRPIFLTAKDNLFSDLFRDLIDIGFDPAVPIETLAGYKEFEQQLTSEEETADPEESGADDEDAEDTTIIIKKPVYRKNVNYESEVRAKEKDTKIKRCIPFIVNGGGYKTAIRDKEGNILYKGLVGSDNMKIIKSMKVPAEYKFIIATYSQFAAKKETEKKTFLRALAQNNIIILDESHKAGGASNTGEYFRKTLSETKGVVFLSATFAKKPENMPIYAAKTSISEANMTNESLVEAISKGGIALQEVISAQLVQEGQMIRRERSSEGTEVNYVNLDSSQDEIGHPQFNKEKEHRLISDKATEIFRMIIAFQTHYVTPVIKDLDKIAKAEYAEVEQRKGTQEAGISNPPVFNGIFQFIFQLLFAIKAETVAQMAILRLKEGKKPIIAFSSTMESFLDALTNEEGKPIAINDRIPYDFSAVLKRRLEGVLRYTIIKPDGARVYEKIKVTEQGPEFQVEYFRIAELINKASVGISMSPIDIIIDRIEKAGFSIGEVTGRDTVLKPINEKIAVVKPRYKENSSDIFRKFQDNELDALLINLSGAVGASAHAVPTSKVPKDKVKQRCMIVLQPELDINMEVQKRGRISRTGQIYKPIYDYAISAVPAEQRLMMMLQRKLKSLDANTTSNQKESKKILDIEDFLNKYGDKVTVDYLKENSEINIMLGDPMKLESAKASGSGDEDKKVETAGAASKVTGRIAILSTDMQESFYRDIIERYRSEVQYAKETGEYDLEVDRIDLQAETLSKDIIVVGLGGQSVFARNTILEKCEINAQKKPYTQDELRDLIQKALTVTDENGENPVEYTGRELREEMVKEYTEWWGHALTKENTNLDVHYQKLNDNITKETGYLALKSDKERSMYLSERRDTIAEAKVTAKELAAFRANNKKEHIMSLFESFVVGEAVAFPTRTFLVDQSYYKGIFLGLEINKTKSNPYAPSAIKIKVAFPNSTKYVAIPASKNEIVMQMQNLTGSRIMYNEGQRIVDTWNTLRQESSKDRQRRFIATGNILQAYGKEELQGGKLISYTIKGGGEKKGILLPEEFTPEGSRDKKEMRVTVPIKMALPIIKSMVQGGSTTSTDKLFSLQLTEDGYAIYVPLTKKLNEKFITNEALLSMTNEGVFEQGRYMRDKMTATIPHSKVTALVELLQKEYNMSVDVLRTAIIDLEGIGDDEYEDEIKVVQPETDNILTALSEVDAQEEALEKEKQLTAELEAGREALEKEEATKREMEAFERDKRLMSVKKKMINLSKILGGVKGMARGGELIEDSYFQMLMNGYGDMNNFKGGWMDAEARIKMSHALAKDYGWNETQRINFLKYADNYYGADKKDDNYFVKGGEIKEGTQKFRLMWSLKNQDGVQSKEFDTREPAQKLFDEMKSRPDMELMMLDLNVFNEANSIIDHRSILIYPK